MTQGYDSQLALGARDEAVERVERHAEPDWKAVAEDAVQKLALHRPEFTTDAVWWLIEQMTDARPHEERAMGAVMQNAQRWGWITPTNRTHISVRPRCHARPVRIWKSLIYVEAS